ncbi:hypothetical protein FPQ18DRAFT_316045 [Pyronema domesticum]|uniref:Similar to Acylpyruvase FAHD1, mitochondrial acc. no. Q8R0F8 n=1 Tax=Pyronema omphalodes (strain CBS 100304) TaxID=1076935 RepID=U4KU04_PYROM|nr:hypothetical protein FPQ18DRAFT_316045 [Pyronema domesticum]CCX04623.1 Similar to Acylpyruvase FAHD1, mitochondrial; acc. no. Q8R0F8 [Pyronema omphalodes CBS 100304]
MASNLLRLSRPRTIACIGRNYADHIAELGNTRPTEPFYFLKPATTILQPKAGPILAPKNSNLHYEVELAAVIGSTVEELPNSKEALKAVKGWAVGIDMTARNFQEAAKKKGLPWSLCKGFKTFLPVSHFIPASKIPNPHDVELYLKVNGELKQCDKTSLMLFDIPRLLQHVTSVMPLEEDDLLLTGTPKGVGPVVDGDLIEAGIRVNGIELEEGRIEVRVQERETGYNSGAKL